MNTSAPQRNDAVRIRNSYFQDLILIFVFLNGSYEPSECKRFIESFGVLASPDEEQMRTRQYFKWKQYVDAAKQKLLKKQMLVGVGNRRFEIHSERGNEALSQVSDFLEVITPVA